MVCEQPNTAIHGKSRTCSRPSEKPNTGYIVHLSLHIESWLAQLHHHQLPVNWTNEHCINTSCIIIVTSSSPYPYRNIEYKSSWEGHKSPQFPELSTKMSTKRIHQPSSQPHCHATISPLTSPNHRTQLHPLSHLRMQIHAAQCL